MNVLVTGGCGFVGSHLVDALVERGDRVTVLDNLATSNGEWLNPRAEFLLRDVRHRLSDLEHTPKIIYHMAALARIQPSFSRPYETVDVNAGGTLQVLEYARLVEARVVYAGSSSFYGGPLKNPYAYSKWVGEEHCKMYSRLYGVSTAVARFFNVYGPRQVGSGDNATLIGIFETLRRAGRPLTVTGDGQKKRDFTHVSDIVSALVRMGERPWYGEEFDLGRGKNYSVNEVAAMFGGPVQYVAERPGEAEATLADTAAAREKLGWEPAENLPDYVRSLGL